MRRREFIALLGGGVAWPLATLVGGAVATWPLAARGQQKTIRVIGFLGSAPATHLTSALERRLRDLGWIEGRNVMIEYRYAGGDPAHFPGPVEELVRLQPDVMVAGNTQVAIAMKQATATIPIVAPTLIDPVALGLVASHARPGGNVTGIVGTVETLPEKHLALAAEIVPGAVKFGMLLNPEFQAHASQRKGVERAAKVLAVKLVTVEARLPEDLDAAFQSLAREGPDGVLVLNDPIFFAERRRIAALAIAARLPTMYGLREHAEAGGLMSYGPDLRTSFRRAADYV